MKILHKKAFYYGIGWFAAIALSYWLGKYSNSTAVKAPNLYYEAPWELICYLVPGILFIIYAIRPESTIGFLCGKFYDITQREVFDKLEKSFAKIVNFFTKNKKEN